MKTKEEILNNILSKENIEKIKKDEQLDTKELNIECLTSIRSNNLNNIFNLNWQSENDNKDTVKNGFIFVEYVPNEESDNNSDQNKNSIFKKVKKPKPLSHKESPAYGDDMDIDFPH